MDAEVAGGKFPRLTKLIKMASYVRLFRLLRLSRIITRLEEALEIKHSVIDIAKFALFMVVVAHWFACLFFAVASYEDLQVGVCNIV
jgi:hyperpolarization activated cyclic nucleotide-gated potassium channel 2